MSESRVKKSLLNAKVNLIFYVLTLFLSFFSRKIFLDCLGADFVGLTGTLMTLLGFLNLAEMGIGSAVAFALYKPLAVGNRTEIIEVVSVLGFLYKRIGIIVSILVITGLFFLPCFFAKENVDVGVILAVYIVFSVSSLTGYFFNYKQILLNADQRGYVVTTYTQGCSLLKIILQLIVVLHWGNYYAWCGIELIFCILYTFLFNERINSVYPWLSSSVLIGKRVYPSYKRVVTMAKQIFLHRLAVVIQWQSAPILICTFASLHAVAMYGNYTIVVDKLTQLLNNALESTGAAVGNLIATSDEKRVLAIFWELMSFRIWIASSIVACVYLLIDPFIVLWLGDTYVLSQDILIVMLLNVFLTIIGAGIGQFVSGSGLYKDIWAPVVHIVVVILSSIFFGMKYGLLGVLLGTLIGHVVITVGWKPSFLFMYRFNMNPFHFFWGVTWRMISVFVAIIVACLVSDYCGCFVSNESWGGWLSCACINSSIVFGLALFFLYVIDSSFRSFLNKLVCAFNKK